MFKPHEFAKKIGVSVKTLQRWDVEGKLPAKRTLSGHRFYTEDDLLITQGLKPVESKRKVVVYCRVSSSSQKPELRNQISAMETFCLNRGLAVDDWVSEIGGGLNFKRKKFLSIILSMLKGEISTIVVAHKDRMCRFAFDLIMELASSVGCQIIVANQESLSPQQELVEDLMAIIHCFSSRLYGLRNYSKEIKDSLKNAINKPLQDMSDLDSKEIQC
ncbi:IS607 family transposase [Anabaenopsis elenkinii]|uniref:IS607 family transposase n=1 Tax=Anabaenopsis elenkinii CCIBt3563 TaxID=2779889 RepID=A0A7S6RGY6_9CYAN|nr:IS607 family transposase [Anabaenopsis elenkinii]QOV24713.1 IS607 family transposase [Anabaenopsis elenkinii CCIBt3563]